MLDLTVSGKEYLQTVYGDVRESLMEQPMTQARHCRHCLGDCTGDCLIGGGLCIHGWNEKPPRRFYWRLVLTRRWWYRVFWGPSR